MRHHGLLAGILSLLLVGLGFLLGQFHAFNHLLLPQGAKIWTASGLLPIWSDADDLMPLPGKASVPETNLQQTNDRASLFPARVGDLHMDKLISGEEAMEYARRIHGSSAPMERVFIPFYSSKDAQVTVWIFEMNSMHDALMHMERINERMHAAQEKNDYGTFYLQDVEINYLQSANTKNYYYRKGNKIYWISMVASSPMPLFLRFYASF